MQNQSNSLITFDTQLKTALLSSLLLLLLLLLLEAKNTPSYFIPCVQTNKVFWGCRDGAVMRAFASHQCGPDSILRLGAICGLSLLVLYSAPRGFSPGTPVFPSPQKPTFVLICLISAN